MVLIITHVPTTLIMRIHPDRIEVNTSSETQGNPYRTGDAELLGNGFWLVTLFVIFSFFRIHEAFPIIYNFKIPLLLSLGALAALAFHLLISRQLTAFWHPSLKWLCIFWGR